MRRQLRRAAVVCAAILSVLAVLWGLNKAFPLALPDQQQLFARLVTDRDGQPLRAFADARGVWRYPVTIEQVSPAYLEALLGYEDRWFWWHPGINPLALVRASVQNLRSGRVISGGSTLSMQVARILHPHRRTLAGKLQQLLRTLQLEWQLSKSEILTLYLNLAPFGGTVEGVQAASYSYLNKPASALTDAEAALLAVLPQAPSRLRPDRYPERAQRARDKVLNRLATLQIWPEQRVAEAHQEAVYGRAPSPPRDAPLLARRLVQQWPDQRLIRTTLDGNLQRQFASRVRDYSRGLPAASSAAVLLIDNRDGAVLSYVGSADFQDARRFGHVDMVQAQRSPGSTLKPFLYGMALDAGLIHTASLLSDTPRFGLAYQPGNFSGGFSGPVRADQALRRSLNIPAVNLLEHLGVHQFSARLSNAGMALAIPGGRASAALVLGGGGLSLAQLVAGYRALGGSGQVVPLRYSQSDILSDIHKQARYLLSPGAASLVHQMLQPPPARGSRLSRLKPAAMVWKTGTSYGFRDSWAIGVSREYSLGVWVGRPDGTPLPGFYGRNTAVPLLRQLSALLPEQSAPVQPESVSRATICWPSGLRLQPGQPCSRSQQALLLNDTAPPTLISPDAPLGTRLQLDYWLNLQGERVVPGCAQGPVSRKRLWRWPLALEPWLPAGQRRARLTPAWSAACQAQQHSTITAPLRIVGLENGTRLRQAPGSHQPPMLQLNSEGGQGLRHWYLNGQHIASVRAGQLTQWSFSHQGKAEVLVIDESGQLDRVEVWGE